MGSITLSASLEYGKIAIGNDKSTQHLLVTLEGKKVAIDNRKPLALAAVIDCSGSMAGEKIETAKRTLVKLIENLSSEDTLGCAGFSDNVFQIFPAQKMTPEAKEKAKAEVDKLRSMASTNLAGGMLEGFSMLKDMAQSYDLIRVFLMTDGLPNVGVSSHEGLIEMVKGRPERVTLSTFGYGQDHDPELLTSMAKTGKGNFYFIKTIDECPSVFGRELGGLLTCSAQNIKVKVKGKPDVKLLEVLSDFDVDGKDDKSEAVVTVDDVYSEERRKVLFKVELPAFDKVPPRPLKVADIEVDYYDVQAKEPRQETAKVEVEYAKEADAQKEAAKEVQEELAKLAAIKAQEEAMKLAKMGNFIGAQQVVMDAAMCCSAVGTVMSDAYAEDLRNNVIPLLDKQKYAAGGALYMQANVGSYSAGRGQTAGTAPIFSTPAAKSTSKKFEEDEPMKILPSKPIKIQKPPMLENKPKNEGLSKHRTKRS